MKLHIVFDWQMEQMELEISLKVMNTPRRHLDTVATQNSYKNLKAIFKVP